VAGIMRMNVYKFLFWVLLWESIICTILIYGGNEILEKIW
jgi:membrane protein DedA with SNARE-associated domain